MQNREADLDIVASSTSCYNYRGPIESHCRKAFGTMPEPLTPFRRSPESPRGLLIHFLHDRHGCTF